MKSPGKEIGSWTRFVNGLTVLALIVAGCTSIEGKSGKGTITPEPTPTCVPVTPSEWQETKMKEAKAHADAALAYSGSSDATIRSLMVVEISEAEKAKLEAEDYSRLCGFPFQTPTPTPGK